MSETELSTAWHHIARRTQAKINLAWWLDQFTPLIIVLSFITAAATLYLRSHNNAPSTNTLLSAFSLALIILAITAWLTSRNHYIRLQDALTHLDDQLNLNNALTTADRGIGSWPPSPLSPQSINSGLDWHWPRIVSPFILSTLVLIAAFFIPVSIIQLNTSLPASQPRSWEQMDELLLIAEETELIDEPALDEMREKVEELRDQGKEDWFSHSSMEASDSLRDALEQQLEQLGSDLADSERSLDAFQNFSDQMNENTKNLLLEQYNQALKNLDKGALPINSQMMEALKNIDPAQLKNLSQLSKEQMDQLREQLKKGAQAIKEAGMAGEKGIPALGEGDMISYLMEQNSKKPGRGGINRGPGEAPISLGNPNDLDTNNLEAVQNPDLSHAAPGDLLKMSQSEHQLDKSKSQQQQGGTVKSSGKGGDTIWKESLMPAEKELLKRYFKTP